MERQYSRFVRFMIIPLLALFFTSCGSKKMQRSPASTPAALSRQFGVRVTSSDNIKLYTEASAWLGTPYRYGGNTKRGTDCSGFTGQVYKQVYRKELRRSTGDILAYNCKKVSKGKLREGDLVFFNTSGKSKKVPSHVGIYLKNGKFVHASTSRGVIVSSLSEPYYMRTWMTGGRVK